jgi:nucleotide sugar dehydrogenase
MKIGIIGNGFVGKATNILKCDNVELVVYDINPEICVPKGTTLNDICQCDIIFISVPTPMNKDGSCYIGIVENVVKDISEIVNLDEKLVVIRSTIPPGTSDRLNCYFMPEFLTEKNYEYDFINCKNWIFGIKGTTQDTLFRYKIMELINYSYNEECIKYRNVSFVKNSEAEMIKMFRNNFLALKVSFCNEIEELCRKLNITYENVRLLAVLDDRIGKSHSDVPGHDGHRGYGGTCFPKDSNSLYNIMKDANMESYIIKNMILRNENVDRVEKDWSEDHGRAVI